MNVLFAASECIPFVKTGGLADVIGSLPRALKSKGVTARVVLPKYSDIPAHFQEKMELKHTFTVPISWRNQYCGIEELTYDDITYYFIDNKYYFGRSGLYGYFDEAERFAFFSKAVLEMLAYLDFKPDILHCHDWQTGLVSILQNAHYNYLQDLRTVFTIHNLKFQGIFAADILGGVIGLSPEYFTIDGLEYHGDVNFMKGALNYADVVTTVSNTYANEIQTPYYGEGMDGLLRKRAGDLYGIVNGIDYDKFNPETDEHLFVNYKDSLTEKRENKVALQEMLGLPVDKDKPMIGIITRLTEQKGIDLIIHVLREIMEMDLQLVLLGTGDQKYEDAFKQASWEYPDKLSANITFNEDLANKIYAASDLFLMPSRFEPCGISQLISLRYLTVPIVRETGGLVDTVQPYNEQTQEGNGFSFTNYNAHDMLNTIKRAINYYQDNESWKRILENAAKCDFSWNKSAEEYVKLYESLL